MVCLDVCTYRGDEFQIAFTQIGDLRSIIPDEVNVLALTGTVTSSIYDSVLKRLSLKDPTVVGDSPSRDNIKYFVEPLISAKKLCKLFAEKIRSNRIHFPKTLIFCSTIAECSLLYRTLRAQLGDDFMEPPGYPDFHKHRLVDMCTRAMSDEMKRIFLIHS